MNASGDEETVHATAAVVGERGVLVRGPSGSGKTSLALALVEAARTRGAFARLVADDRVLVARRGGRLVARPHPALAGLVERRGLGIVPVPHEPACVLALAVDLVVRRKRMEHPLAEVGPPTPVWCTGSAHSEGEPPEWAGAPETPERVPAPEALRCTIAGIALPRLAVRAGAAADAAALVLAALSAAGEAGDSDPISLAKLAAMHKIAPEPNRRAGNPPKA